jgi:hypothetical protein
MKPDDRRKRCEDPASKESLVSNLANVRDSDEANKNGLRKRITPLTASSWVEAILFLRSKVKNEAKQRDQARKRPGFARFGASSQGRKEEEEEREGAKAEVGEGRYVLPGLIYNNNATELFPNV